MAAALAEGRISGYCVAEPFGAKSVAVDKGKTLFESQDLWEGSVCCGLVLRNDFIKNNEAIAEEFIKEYRPTFQRIKICHSAFAFFSD